MLYQVHHNTDNNFGHIVSASSHLWPGFRNRVVPCRNTIVLLRRLSCWSSLLPSLSENCGFLYWPQTRNSSCSVLLSAFMRSFCTFASWTYLCRPLCHVALLSTSFEIGAWKFVPRYGKKDGNKYTQECKSALTFRLWHGTDAMQSSYHRWYSNANHTQTGQNLSLEGWSLLRLLTTDTAVRNVASLCHGCSHVYYTIQSRVNG